MRPPEFTGGNLGSGGVLVEQRQVASMRPPEFTGGNRRTSGTYSPPHSSRFNEAAGIHRRKPPRRRRPPPSPARGFNEAAGIHRRKPAKGGWHASADHPRFNEAAGIHRRKRELHARLASLAPGASMRPPEFTGGNAMVHDLLDPRPPCFNEAAGIHRRKHPTRRASPYAPVTLQ